MSCKKSEIVYLGGLLFFTPSPVLSNSCGFSISKKLLTLSIKTMFVNLNKMSHRGRTSLLHGPLSHLKFLPEEYYESINELWVRMFPPCNPQDRVVTWFNGDSSEGSISQPAKQVNYSYFSPGYLTLNQAVLRQIYWATPLPTNHHPTNSWFLRWETTWRNWELSIKST